MSFVIMSSLVHSCHSLHGVEDLSLNVWMRWIKEETALSKGPHVKNC